MLTIYCCWHLWHASSSPKDKNNYSVCRCNFSLTIFLYCVTVIVLTVGVFAKPKVQHLTFLQNTQFAKFYESQKLNFRHWIPKTIIDWAYYTSRFLWNNEIYLAWIIKSWIKPYLAHLWYSVLTDDIIR